MPDESPAPVQVSDSSRNRIYSLDSFSTRLIPPAAIALAWWLSGIELIETSERGKDWKVLAVAFAVFWLAACGSRLVALRPRQATWLAGALAGAGIICGCLASGGASYRNDVFYGATHALFIVSLGLFIFIAMTRREKKQSPDKPKDAAAATPSSKPSELPKTVETKP